MAWSDYPLRSISIPADHGPTQPYVYVGDDDPLATKVGQDAAVVFHFGSHNSGFILAVNDTSAPGNDEGIFSLYATSDQNGGVIAPVIQADYNAGAGTLNTVYGDPVAGANAFLRGDSVTVNAISGINLDGGAGQPVLVSQDLMVDSRSHRFMRGEANSVSMSFVGVTSSTVAVPFTHTFSAPPKVTTNINNGAGATAQWHSRAISVTTTGFTMLVFASAAGTWSGVEVQWQAVEATP